MGCTGGRVCRWAHPRSRGEHGATWTCWKSKPGSSPLARGTRLLPLGGLRLIGLIPARAGNTAQPATKAGFFGAHPRSRGEHVKCHGVAVAREGSSPLARGTLWPLRKTLPFRGLIPARAGNTLGLGGLDRLGWAHPRSRGEHRLFHGVIPFG